VITRHQLPVEAFRALASGGGGPAVVEHLRQAEHSKHLMLLRGTAMEAAERDPASPEIASFLDALKLLAKVQETDPGAFAWLLGLPQVGAWTHDCLQRTDQGLPPDFSYLASAAAAAGVRVGVPFELDAPVRDGAMAFPGLGHFDGIDGQSWVRLRSDGERLTVGALTTAPCSALVPDDGTAEPVPYWHGTPAARVTAEGHTWSVLLEGTDRYLDRFARPMAAALTAAEAGRWRIRLQGAWEVLVRHHRWAAESIAAGVSVLVPLTARSDTDLESATTPAAFGAIATSWPPDPVIMAEILVHEFQHLKLCGLLDLVRLTQPCDELVYAAWRKDPRPPSGLLQGVYAHLGIARFWNVQRRAETEPDEIFRAEVMFERWRSTIGPSLATLVRMGCLTEDGVTFVSMLRDEGQRLESEPVPIGARAVASDVALDHSLTWQLSHMAIGAAEVAGLAAAYQRGEPLPDRALPEVRIEEETRKVTSTVRGRLLRMRCLEPRRSREQSVAEIPGLSAADALLLSGQASAAVRAYRDEILAAVEPLPEAWVGLAHAAQRLDQTPSLPALATRLPVVFDVHACLVAQGVRSDPLELAAWFG
jgi:HEXXH motif-containing protein